MYRRSNTLLLVLMMVPALILLLWPTLGQSPLPLPQPAAGGTRGPSALVFRPDGRLLYVAEQDENQVALLEPDTGKTQALIPSGGEQPTALALSPDGRTLAVANSVSGSLGLLDTDRRTLRATAPLPGGPYGVAITPAGQAFVSVSRLNQVAVVDLATAKVTARIPVDRRPRAIALTPDGATLLCANMSGGSLSLIDVATYKERGRIALPAINLRGIAVSSDGAHVFVTGQQPHNDQPTERPETMWSNVLCCVRLANGSGTVERVITLDQPDHGAADPNGVVLDPAEKTAYVALSGTHEVALVPLAQALANDTGTSAVRRVLVGCNPRALALRPHTAEVWVANHLGNSLNVLPDGAETGLRFVDLGAATPSPNRRLPGRFLFTSAHMSRGMFFTCETCHPDGGAEGLSWKFAHVKDGLDLRNTRDLRGNLLLTAPYGWTAREDDFENFVNDELAGLMKTRKLPHHEIHAFWDLVNESPLPPNPYRNPDGSLTAAALRGKALFVGEAGCDTCHVGNEHGGTKRLEWIGTTPEGLKLDVPHLTGVYDSAPYLHDGRAATLEEIFTRYNPAHLHGKAHLLTPSQLQDLLEYVREL